MRNSILRWHLFRYIFSLEIEENEPSKEKRKPSAQTDDNGWIEFSFHSEISGFFGDRFEGDGFVEEEGRVGGFVERSETLESWC